jgi:hypothetical protein
MKKTMEQAVAMDEANVSRVAYQLWENAGRPAGRDLEFWLEAEARVRATSERASVAQKAEVAPVVAVAEKAPRASRPARNGVKKSWPKPYPSLPKF